MIARAAVPAPAAAAPAVESAPGGEGSPGMRVKVCGLTTRDDVLHAVDCGADAVGFVFVPGSRRCADPEVVAHVVGELPPWVATIGVFQDQPAASVRRCMAECGLRVAQLHGDENLAYVRAVAVPVLKALSVGNRMDPVRFSAYPGLDVFLLDTDPAPRSRDLRLQPLCARPRGGTGRTFDWAVAADVGHKVRVVLAGGLSPDNVKRAIQAARPWAVDVASGTECSPGRKDRELVRRFVLAARRAAVEAGLETLAGGGPDEWGVRL